MPTKTITIDLEAYRRLKAVQKPNESLSETIKRVIRPSLDLRTWFKSMEEKPMSRKAIRAVEEHMALRHRPSSRRR